MVDQGHGVWLHAIARDLDPARLAGLAGISGEPVRSIRSAGLDAVVSPVDLAEYGEDALRRNLEDIAWLESTARAHHEVVSAVGGVGSVLPARLATVYESAARVAEVVAERRQEFVAALDRLVDRAEWGVKAFAVPDTRAAGTIPAATIPAATVPAGELGGAGGAGAAYLRRRRAQLAAREIVQRAALDSVEAVHGALERRADAATRHRPRDRRLSSDPGAMLLNGAYLVETRRAAAFADAVGELAEHHPAISLQLTGPWPPYSFVALDLGPAASRRGVQR
jgi:hypothetical protein